MRTEQLYVAESVLVNQVYVKHQRKNSGLSVSSNLFGCLWRAAAVTVSFLEYPLIYIINICRNLIELILLIQLQQSSGTDAKAEILVIYLLFHDPSPSTSPSENTRIVSQRLREHSVVHKQEL